MTHAEGQRWEKSSAERWKEQSKLSREDSWPESRWISRISLVRPSYGRVFLVERTIYNGMESGKVLFEQLQIVL